MTTTNPPSNAATLAAGAARENYLTVAEIAARLRVAKMTVYRFAHSGELPGAIRVGRSIRVPEASVEAYLAESGLGQSDCELQLTVADVQALLDSMESNDHCTIAYHVQIKLVRERIERFAGGGGLILKRDPA